eukprot:scaffold72535_cov65-Phaeocystis_antarctica.AAC.1
MHTCAALPSPGQGGSTGALPPNPREHQSWVRCTRWQCTCITHALHCPVTESKNPSRQIMVARGLCAAASAVRPAAIPAVITLRRAASHECEDAFVEVDIASSASTQ